jgi:hypothetical protein
MYTKPLATHWAKKFYYKRVITRTMRVKKLSEVLLFSCTSTEIEHRVYYMITAFILPWLHTTTHNYAS